MKGFPERSQLGIEPAIIEELMKGYQRPEDLAGAGVIIGAISKKAPARGTRREQFP
jgi:hypothetical protein